MPPIGPAPGSRDQHSASGTDPASGTEAPASKDLLAWSDQEAEPRRGLLPPTRRDVATAVALLVAGFAWGAALAFTESLPVDFGFLVFVLQLGVGLVFIVTLVHRLLFRGFHVDRVVIIAALVVGGGALGLEIGPTVPPAAWLLLLLPFPIALKIRKLRHQRKKLQKSPTKNFLKSPNQANLFFLSTSS